MNEYLSSIDVSVLWTGSDTRSGIDYYEIKLDDGDFVKVGESTYYKYLGIAEGKHSVYIRCMDIAGNVNELATTFYIDITTRNIFTKTPGSKT